MGQEIAKQYLLLNGLTILEHSLYKLFSCKAIHHVHVILQENDNTGLAVLEKFSSEVTIVSGGSRRADSVFNGLSAIQTKAEDSDWVLVHDAARPCVRPADIELLLQTIADHQVGGVLGGPLTDTVKRVNEDRRIDGTLPRDQLWRAYTPQIFRFGLLRTALAQALASGVEITDEASAIELAGYSPVIVEGHNDNIKITQPQDLAIAGLYLKLQGEDQQDIVR